MKKYFLVALILGVLFFAGCGAPEPKRLGDDYSDFDLADVKDLSELEAEAVAQTQELAAQEKVPHEVVETSIISADTNVDDLFACVEDDDCELIRPAQCCSCPVAVSRFLSAKIQSTALNKPLSCTDDFLCGTCIEADELIPRCVSGKCIAERQVEECAVCDVVDPRDRQLLDSEIIRHPAPALPEESNFKTLVAKTSCQPGTDHPAAYFHYTLKTPAATYFEVKESDQDDAEYKTVHEIGPLFEVEQTIVMCDRCRIHAAPEIKLDKTYHVRIRSDFKGDITYSGVYILDTNYNSEYLQTNC